MLIRSGDSSIWIEMSDRPNNSQRPGDVRLLVDVVSVGFSGRAAVWVAADALNEFVRHLRTLEQERRGAATLASMSPGELDLELKSINARGGMAIIAAVVHHEHLGDGGPYAHGVKVGFEFDPTMLPEILASFEEMSS